MHFVTHYRCHTMHHYNLLMTLLEKIIFSNHIHSLTHYRYQTMHHKKVVIHYVNYHKVDNSLIYNDALTDTDNEANIYS